MIAPDAHVYAFYLWKTKGNMQKAADIINVGKDAFWFKTKAYGLNFRDFRGEMCTCNKGKPRCEVCKARNRVTARNRYYRNKAIRPTVAAENKARKNIEKINRMMTLSNQMAAMRKFLQLSK